ncbi:14885_t:CDS:2, partial [Cetraspora pellucida]
MSQKEYKSVYGYEHNYPQSKTIKCKARLYTFIYNILEKGIYPSSSILQQTAKPKQYKVSDKYKIKTTWGKLKQEITIIASINYVDQKPIYKIQWTDKITCQEKEIQLNKSSSNATSLFSMEYNKGKKTEYSGLEIFSLQLEPVEK